MILLYRNHFCSYTISVTSVASEKKRKLCFDKCTFATKNSKEKKSKNLQN